MANPLLNPSDDLEAGFRQQVESRSTDATIQEFEERMRSQAEANKPAPQPPKIERDQDGHPYVQAGPDFDPSQVAVPDGIPVYTGDVEADMRAAETTMAGKIVNRLMGVGGQERYQLWPERMVRSATTLAGDVMSGKEAVTTGLRREDFTDEPAPGVGAPREGGIPGVESFLRPVAQQPGDRVVERAQDLAGVAVTAGMPVAQRGALGAAGGRVTAPEIPASVRTPEEAITAVAAKLGTTPDAVQTSWGYANPADYLALARAQGIEVTPPVEPFYSAVARAVETSPMESASASDWAGYLKNRQGLKQEELDWLGIEPWLKERGGKVSKADVANFVREHEVQVQTVRKSNEIAGAADEVALAEKANEVFGAWEDAPADYADGLIATARTDGMVSIQAPDGIVVRVVNAADKDRALVEAKAELRKAIESRDEDTLRDLAVEAADNTLRSRGTGGLDALRAEIPEDFQKVTEAGLEPTVHPENPSIMAFLDRENGDIIDVGDLRNMGRDGFPLDVVAAAERIESRYEAASIGATKYGQWQLPGGENYREILLTLPVRGPSANARAVNEELIRKYGGLEEAFAKWTPEEQARFNAVHAEASRNPNAVESFTSSHWGEPNVLAHARVNDRVIDGKRTLFIEEVQSDWHQQGRKRGYGPPEGPYGWGDTAGNTAGGVPDAPFKTTWPELTLKRLIKEAADQGYQQIAWTDGKVQAARYDLSKQVDSVKAYRNTDGTFNLAADVNGKTQQLASNVTPEKVADHVGKDLAEKIVAQPANDQVVTYAGADLRVGGEGMVGFYDNILVKTANKLVKKFGAKVEDSALDAGRYEIVERNVRGRAGQRGGVEYRINDNARTGDRTYVGGEFRTRSEAQAWIDAQGTGDRIHAMAITPKLADVARNEGFTLFQAGLPMPSGPAGEGQDDFLKRMQQQPTGTTVFDTGAPPMALVPGVVKEISPSAMAKAMEMTGAVVKDIAKGVFRESPRAAVRGVLKAADNTAVALNDLGDWLDQNVADLSINVPSSGNATVDALGRAVLNPVDAIKRSLDALVAYVPQPETVTGHMIESTAQFLAGFIPALRVARASGLGAVAAPVVAGAGSSFLTMNPDEGNLSNFIQSFPMLAGPVTQYLATDPNSPDGLNRLRNAVEAASFGILTDVVVRGLRYAANTRKAVNATQALRDADTAAGTVVNQSMDGALGAVDQPLVVVKGKSARPVGPSVPAGDNVPGRAATALGRSAAETVLGVPDQVAATGVVKDAQTGLLQLVDSGPEGTNQAVKAGRKGVYINLGRVETADDVKAMIQQVADAMQPEVTTAKRGVMPLDETARLADRLGMTAEELIARPKGQALNAEQIVAANRILTTSAENLWALAEKAAAPTSSVLDGYNFRRALTVHNAVQQAVLGANAEAGRALSALRIARSSSGAAMNRELNAIMDQLGGQNVAQDIAKTMLDLRAQGLGEGAIEAATRRGWLATTQAMARESYALGQLWNPKTHIRNLTSNLIVSFQQGYERYGAGKIGQLLGTPADEAIVPAESVAYMYGQISSLKDAFRLAGRTLVTGDTTGLLGKIDIPQEAISSAVVSRELGHSAAEAAKFADTAMGRTVDFIGAVTRVPGRSLATEDQFFKTIAFSAEIRAQALRKATQEGLSGQPLANRVADLVANPPEWLHQAGVDHALYATFNNEPGEVAKALLKIRNFDGVVNPTFMIAPYLRTPANILRYTANRSPLAALSRQWWDDLSAGGARRDLALARMSMGTAVMAVALDYASSGVLTGAGPANPAQKEALRGTGWQPYSIKIGDKYFSYQGTDPYATPFAFAAGIAEMVKASDLSPEDFDTFEELLGQASGIVATNIVDKSYFQGVAGFVRAIEDAGKGQPGAISSYITRQVSSIVPLASLGRTVNDMLDNTRREPANIWEGIQSQIPGLAQRLIPSRTVWGAPVKPQEVYGHFYDLASPFYVSRETGSPVDDELTRLNSGVQRIPWKASFAGVQVNFHDHPQVLDEYRRFAGNELKHPAWQLGAKDFLDQVVSGQHSMSGVYRILSDGPDGGKAAFIKNTVSEYRKLAQQEILTTAEQRYPTFFEYVTGKQAAAQELKMPVEPVPAR